MSLKTLKVTSYSSCNVNLNSPFCKSTNALLLAKNDLSRIMGISISSFISRMMKSPRKINLSIFTSTSSIIPHRCVRDLSVKCNVTIVGHASPKLSFLKMESDVKLILDPKSQSAFSKIEFPIAHGIINLYGSLSLGDNFFCKMALHSFESATVSNSPYFLFLTRVSFMNFT